jgi:alkanesulfonate monooxygenase
MPVEFIGMIGTRPASELDGPSGSLIGGTVQPDYVRHFAKVHEDGDFDRILIGYGSTGPDGFSVASYVASVTERLKLLIAHRPGFVAPTLAARKLATLDHFTNGRIAVHIISGGNDAEQQRDGDWFDHDRRYRRTDEYLYILRQTWSSDQPWSYFGEYYRVKDAFSDVKPLQQPHIPIYFGGASEMAVGVGAKHCDVYAMWGEPIAAIKQRMAAVKAVAPQGKSLRFSVSLRPILGNTEEQAWERAHSILARIKAAVVPHPTSSPLLVVPIWLQFIHRQSGRSDSFSLLKRVRFTISDYGQRSLRPQEPTATPQHWLARQNKLPNLWWTITTQG